MTLAEALTVLAAWFAVVFMVWVYFDQKKRQSEEDSYRRFHNFRMANTAMTEAAKLREVVDAALEQYELRKRRPNHKRKSFTLGDAG